ncbi:MAG: restriction endonuclease subunit S [Kiritimatiellae bacterium]|nr:restriction endonuclease subunit S [Kiritimatiellia bacterium]
MKPYPRYKPFPELWMTRVPEHWSRRKIKYLFSERNEKGFPNESLLAATQNHGVIPKTDYENRTVEALKDLHLLKLVRVGDFVISLRSFQGGIEYAYHQGIISPAYTIMIPSENIDSGFFRHLAKSAPFLDLLRLCVTGIREGQNIDYERLKNHYIPLPPPSEQDRIVRYLDEKTAAIDELVRAKEREIELLRERKQALVSAAVIGRDISTKCPFGRDASTIRPGCGRAVGASLPVYRLKELVRFFKGLNITKADLIPEGANVISYGQIHSKENDGRSLKDSFLRHTSFELTNDAARLFFGDIVFADTSEDQTGIGNCVLNDRHEPVWAGYHTVTARPRDPEIAPYLAILFQSNWWRDQLRRSSDGVKVYSVTQRSLGNTRVVLPLLPEQRRIVAHLDSVCADFAAGEAAIRKQISLLQELRTRLVSDAVTGAVEV